MIHAPLHRHACNALAKGVAFAINKYTMKISTLCKEVIQSPETFDFAKAVAEHVLSRDYNPYGVPPSLEESLSEAVRQKSDSLIMRLTYSVLEITPMDIEAHALLSMAAFRQCRKDIHHLHNFIASRLLDRLLATGDGKTYVSAFKITLPKDELALFHHLKLFPTSRVSQEREDNAYDIYTLQDNECLYFDISIPFKKQMDLIPGRETAPRNGRERESDL